MMTNHLVIIVAVLAVLIIVFFVFNRNTMRPVVSTSSTTHEVTGLDGIISSIQPGVLFGQGGGVSQGGLLGLLAGKSTGSNVTGTGGTSLSDAGQGGALQQSSTPALAGDGGSMSDTTV